MIKKHIIGNLVLIAIWYILSFSIGPRFVPFFHTVIIEIIVNFKVLLPHFMATLLRLLIGYFIALIFGILIGIWMSYSKRADDIFSPIIASVNPIPKSALVPVFLIIFGLGNLARIMIVVFIIIFPIIISTKHSIDSIPQEYFIISKTLGLSKADEYKKIVFKAILPDLLSIMKVTTAMAIAVLYISENIGAKYGLGYYIGSNNGVNNVEMYSAIVLLSMMGYVIVIILDIVKNRKCRWV